MLTKFKQHFTKLMKEQQNKMSNTLDKDIDVFIEELKTLLDKLAIIDLVYFDIQFHFYLLETIKDIFRISKKAKLKAKELDRFIDRTQWLEYWLTSNNDDVDNDLINNTVDIELYKLPNYAKNSVLKHLNLLLSKTVDYLPHDGNTKNLEPFMALMNSYRDELLGYIEGGCHWWVYPFTDNNHTFPLRLQLLNQFDRLGDKIEEWNEKGYENKFVKYINDQGYDIFGGWGGLQTNIELNNKKQVSVSQRKNDIGEVEYIDLHREKYNALVNALYRYSFMYFLNDKFNIREVNQLQTYYRSLATCLYYAGNGRHIKRKHILDALREARNMLNKTPKIRLRKDRKYWLSDTMVDGLMKVLNEFIIDRANMITAMVVTHCCDICTPSNDDWIDVVKKHQEYTARSRLEITYPGKEYNEDEIKRIMSLYQQYYVPRYEMFIPNDAMYLFQITLEYWLDIRDDARIDIAYKQLQQWFSNRHTTEENQNFHNESWVYYLFMSHYNKRHLLDKLEKEPIDIINYGGARNTYKALINLMKNELDNYDILYRKHVVVNNTKVETDGSVSTSKSAK